MMEWLAMDGYGGYVWGSYGVAALGIVVELAMLRARQRRALMQVRIEAGDGA